MLLFLYTSDYLEDEDLPASKELLPSIRDIMTKAASDPSKVDEQLFESLPDAVLHAQMYCYGQRYLIRDLPEKSLYRFKTAFMEKSIPVHVLITIVNIAYENSPDDDAGIRKLVVYRCQTSLKHLNDSKAFGELLEQRPEFSRDMITRYRCRNYVWCPDCDKYIDLECCNCGWSSMCGKKSCRYDNREDLSSLNCTSCKTRGRLQLSRPSTDDVDSLLLLPYR